VKNCATGLGFLVLLCVTAYNTWSLQGLRAEVQTLRQELAQQRKTTSLMAKALQALQQAKDAMGKTDTPSAQGALDRARDAVGELVKGAERTAGPVAEWLQEQVRAVAKQIEGQGGQKKP